MKRDVTGSRHLASGKAATRRQTVGARHATDLCVGILQAVRQPHKALAEHRPAGRSGRLADRSDVEQEFLQSIELRRARTCCHVCMTASIRTDTLLTSTRLWHRCHTSSPMETTDASAVDPLRNAEDAQRSDRLQIGMATHFVSLPRPDSRRSIRPHWFRMHTLRDRCAGIKRAAITP